MPAIQAITSAEVERRPSAAERLAELCDAGSLRLIRAGVLSPHLGEDGRPGDGVVGGLGCVDGRQVACYAQDSGYLGGSLGVTHADTIGRVLELAERWRMPVVASVESSGARMQEGIAALGGYARVFRHNVLLSAAVPQISIVGGVSAGGGCYSPALTDFVVMTKQSAMFLTGPRVVREVVGEDVSVDELGGHRVHERNGVCDLVAADDWEATRMARRLLSYLPQHVGALPPRMPPAEPELSNPGAAVPTDPRRVYDVRRVISGIVDVGSLLESAPRWAASIVTAFARIDGRSVGVVANQPRHRGGVLDAASSQKGARFVQICDRFSIPLVVLVDTPGFMPGTRQEHAGVIRFGASLLRAFAASTTTRITLVLRKAFGGAYITMNSKDLGADMVFAWPNAELGVMGAGSAIGILHRRELAAADDLGARRDRLAAGYANRHLSATVAAAGGFVDEIIEPHETRERLAWALAMARHRPPPKTG
jgi:acetyl-CoA carboxylase carboxyltransferase component